MTSCFLYPSSSTCRYTKKLPCSSVRAVWGSEITFSIGEESRNISDKRTGNDIPFVIEFKGNGHIVAVVARCLSVRKQAAVQVLQCIYLIVVGSTEVGGTDGAEIRIILLRNIGAQEQSAVLSDAYERLAYGNIVASFTNRFFTYPLIGEGTACP